MALELKIELFALGVSRTMEFTQDTVVEDAIRQIKETTDHGLTKPDDHGLLLPAHLDGHQPACWLKLDRTLGSYELDNNQTLFFRRRHQAVKVNIEHTDQTTMFLVDTSSPIENVVKHLGDKMGLEHPEDYGLMNEHKDRWLDNESTLIELIEQDASERYSMVIFKKWPAPTVKSAAKN